MELYNILINVNKFNDFVAFKNETSFANKTEMPKLHGIS